MADEANEQRCQEEAACTAASAEMALAKERHRHKEAKHAALSAVSSHAIEQRHHEAAARAAALADMALAKERHCHEMATIAAMLAKSYRQLPAVTGSYRQFPVQAVRTPRIVGISLITLMERKARREMKVM